MLFMNLIKQTATYALSPTVVTVVCPLYESHIDDGWEWWLNEENYSYKCVNENVVWLEPFQRMFMWDP